MSELERLSVQDLEAESATALPTKEVMSLLDLNADVDLALDLAAPVDLAVAANLNIAAPITAAASANILSFGSEATALTDQGVMIDQTQSGDAIANAPQDSVLDQSDDVVGGTDPAPVPDATEGAVTAGDLSTSGNLLDVNLNVDADVDAAAPIAGAVAANANIAAPIDAAVAANIGSIDSDATAVAQQTAIINQDLDGVTADATADQTSKITQ
ncbi:MAG TPA: hypothetical protein VGP53_07375 [Acidimicrobiales bacterium]|nr:hypothetical protein [Acidimicrobiales bacterium]